MKILVFGYNGQIASALRSLWGKRSASAWGHEVRFVNHQEADFTRLETVSAVLDNYKPQMVINAAAYTAVDQAETDREKAEQININAVESIAHWAFQNHCIVIHFSSDYVFSGEGTTPWVETSPYFPLNWYGDTKLRGDQALEKSGCLHLILRISWVYHHSGNNFVKTMLRLGAKLESLRVVNDQIGFPTFADDVAVAIDRILPKITQPQFKNWGTYHLTGAPQEAQFISWFDFAKEIFSLARTSTFPLNIKKLVPIPSREYPTPALRPLNSRLNGQKFFKEFGFSLPPWKESLKRCLEALSAHNTSKNS